jgi:hypothetical protein
LRKVVHLVVENDAGVLGHELGSEQCVDLQTIMRITRTSNAGQ